jgi:IS5 family transposase
MRQVTLASQGSFEKYGRRSKREQFLETMEVVVPWSELKALIEPHYPKAGNGRQPVGLGIMLRVYFLQQWFNLSDPGVEDAFYESPALRRFAGVDWDVRRRRTRRPCCVSAICWKSMSCAARSWTQ